MVEIPEETFLKNTAHQITGVKTKEINFFFTAWLYDYSVFSFRF
jgi:hypothetical protein